MSVYDLYQSYLNQINTPASTMYNPVYISAVNPSSLTTNQDPEKFLDIQYDYSQEPLSNKQSAALSGLGLVGGIPGLMLSSVVGMQRLTNQYPDMFNKGILNLFQSPSVKFDRLYNPANISIFGSQDEDKMGIEPGSFAESMATAESVDGGFNSETSETGYDGGRGYDGGVTGGSFGE